MKPSTKPHASAGGSTPKQARGTEVATAHLEVARLQRRIDARFRKIKEEIAGLRDELHTVATTAIEVATLRALNERQSTEGLARLQDELDEMRAKGIIDGKGNRVRKDLPAEMLQGAACDV